MITFNPRFKYEKLTRIDGPSRLYATPDGSRVPSVTTILNGTADKTALVEWRKRVGDAATTCRTSARRSRWAPSPALPGCRAAVNRPLSSTRSTRRFHAACTARTSWQASTIRSRASNISTRSWTSTSRPSARPLAQSESTTLKRYNGTVEVVGSIPTRSTKLLIIQHQT